MINYLIISHKNPQQLLRLINRLRGIGNKFYIHIDIYSNQNEFEELIFGEDICFIENRFNCIWAHYNFVLATIELMKVSLVNRIGAKLVLLSGQCYPIKKREQLEEIILEDKNSSFIQITKPSWNDFHRRINEYRFDLSNKRFDYIYLKTFNLHSIKLMLRGKISLINLGLLLIKRKFALNLDFFGGSAWWVLNYELSLKFLDYYKRNKRKIDSFFKYSHCPDEFFFQTIINHLLNEDDNQIIYDSVTYVNWTRPNTVLPVTFEKDDINELQNLDNLKLFARKFDYDIDIQIMDLIDSNILNTNK
jgi:hypothetical protein